MISSPGQLGYRPSDPAFIADPYPVFAALRDRHPVSYDDATNQWVISRHEDVARLLRDRNLGRTYRHVATDADFGRTPPPAWHAPVTQGVRTLWMRAASAAGPYIRARRAPRTST